MITRFYTVKESVSLRWTPILEESQAMPGQGTRSMFTVGVGFGLWLGVLAALQMPYTRIRPQVWKKALGLGKDKEAARLRAMQLYPGADLRQGRGVTARVVWLAALGPEQTATIHALSEAELEALARGDPAVTRQVQRAPREASQPSA